MTKSSGFVGCAGVALVSMSILAGGLVRMSKILFYTLCAIMYSTCDLVKDSIHARDIHR